MTEVQNIQMSINKELLQQFIEEKIGQFGFDPNSGLIKVNLNNIPDIIPMNVKFRKEKEVEVVRHKLNGGGT